MSKFEKMEKEIREFHKAWLAEYIAKTIEVKHRIYKKDNLESYKYFYNSSEDSFIYRDRVIEGCSLTQIKSKKTPML